MKTSTIFHMTFGLFIFIFLVSFLAAPLPGRAQEGVYEEPAAVFSREELSQMLAPIALYPDALLSQVLMASTYPIEVIEAERWVKKNQNLNSESLDAALLNKDWDPSVKALCHLPTVLTLMSERIGETTNIGNAFLSQEEEVMNTVQDLRASAYSQGNLKSSSEQKVIVEKETIIIEPADPRVIYVPYYDPFHIYGPWRYPAHQPYYWGPSRVSIGVGISYWPGIFFGFTFGSWSYFDWPHHNIYIDVRYRPRYVSHNRWITKPGPWLHVPRHRKGVAYRDKFTARKYGQYPNRVREFDRGIRGFPDRRDIDRDRRRDDRTRVDRGKQVVRERADQERKTRQRVDLEGQTRQRTEQERQSQQRTSQVRQTRQRTEQEKQSRQLTDRESRTRQRAKQERQLQQSSDQVRQTRQQTEQEKQSRQLTDRESRTRQRAKQERQLQQSSDQVRQTRQRTEQEIQVRYRAERNIFNRVDEGGRERESSERGRMSRQAGRSQGSKGRSLGNGSVRDDQNRRGR